MKLELKDGFDLALVQDALKRLRQIQHHKSSLQSIRLDNLLKQIDELFDGHR